MAGRDLKLQVLLAAVDKVSGPFKRILAGSKGVSAALGQSHAALRKLQQQQDRIASFRKMETQLGQTSSALQAARRDLTALSDQVNAAEAPSKKLTRALQSQAAKVGQLISAEQRHRTTLAAQRGELEKVGISTHRLAVHERQLGRDIEQATRKIAGQKDQLRRLRDVQERAARIHRGGMTATLHGAGAAFAGRRALGAAALPLNDAMDFESAMADVRKVVDFESPEAFAKMGRDVQDLSLRLPMLPEAIAQIVAAAGQAGVARKELLEFAEDATKMSVAFDTTAEDAGQTMATWRTAFRMPQAEVVRLADKINYLGNTGPANVRQISDVVNRVGALGEVAGLQSGPLAALGATVAGMGIQSEVSATGIKNMLLTLSAGAGATKAQRKALAQIGLDAVQMSERMQQDAGGAILLVLDKLRQLPEAAQTGVMTKLFGRESIGAIAPLLTNLELLRENFDKVADAQRYAGSMEAEYAARVATSANMRQLVMNSLRVLSQAVGETLIPDFKELATRTGAVIGRVIAWIRENPTLVKTLAKIAITSAAVVTVLGGLLFAGGMAAMAFAQIHKVVGLLSGGQGIGGLLGSVGRLLPLLGGVSAPVLAIVAVFAAAGLLIWKYWKPIKAFFSGLWDGLVEGFQPLLEILQPAIDWLGDTLSSLLKPADASAESLASIANVGRMVGFAVSSYIVTPLLWLGKLLGWLAFQAVDKVWPALKVVFGWTPMGLIVNNWGRISAFLGTLFDGITRYVTGAWSVITGVFGGDQEKVRAGLMKMWEGINTLLGGWPAKLLQAGVDMIDGLVSGIRSRLGAVKDAISGIAGGAVDKLRNLLGIHSPSRVFAQLGLFTMQGFAGGLQRGQQGPLDRLGAFGNRLRQAGAGLAMAAAAAPAAAVDQRPPLAAPAAASAAGGGITIGAIHIHAAPGMDPQAIARAVRDELEKVQRENAARTRSRLGDYD